MPSILWRPAGLLPCRPWLRFFQLAPVSRPFALPSNPQAWPHNPPAHLSPQSGPLPSPCRDLVSTDPSLPSRPTIPHFFITTACIFFFLRMGGNLSKHSDASSR